MTPAGSRWPVIAPGIVLVLATAAILVAAWRGAFRSMATFPLVFALVVSTVAAVTLLVPRSRRGYAAGLALLAAAVAWGAVWAHAAFLAEQRRLAEEAGATRWVGQRLPAIRYAAAFNVEAEVEVGAEGEAEYRLDTGDVILNVWATWCTPCVEEMPLLEAFWRRQQTSGVRVVGLTRDWGGGESEIADFLAERGIGYPVLLLDDEDYAPLGVERLPTTLWIRDGTVRDYRVSIDGTRELLASLQR